jgi:hypothetical protein
MSRCVFLSRQRCARAPGDAARTTVIRSAIVSLATPAFFCVATLSNAQIRIALPEPASPSPAPEAAINAGHPPAAQAVATHWTLEFRGGFGVSTNPSAGAGQLPGLGATIFPASSIQGPVRAVSSWFFGDGAAQLNSIAASASAPPLPPLDTMLTSRSANRGSGSTWGFTISRDLSAHLSADFNLDRKNQTFGLTSAAAGAIESTRAAFVATWQPLIAETRPDALLFADGPSVTAWNTEVTGAGYQIEASGTLTYRLKPGPGFDPFITVGAGLLADHAEIPPSSVLTGFYGVNVPEPTADLGFSSLVAQKDMLTINTADRGSRLVGILGGGVDKALSARGGLRFAARLAFGSNHPETTIDATPTTPIFEAHAPPKFNGVFTFFNAATTVILPTTLSGPSLTGFKTFSGKGTRIETTITVGYFFRF